MSILFTVIFGCITLTSIPETKINDAAVEVALRAYLDSLSTQIGDQRILSSLIARVERTEHEVVVYVEDVAFMSSFWRNLPDSYSKFEDRIVFWFDKKEGCIGEHCADEFKKFHNQFNDRLIIDFTTDGKLIGKVGLDNSDLKFIGPHRFLVEKNSVVQTRSVCQFPHDVFYELGHLFDDNGDLMYQDNSYSICSLDRPFQFTSEEYEPMEYIRVKSGFGDYFFRQHDLGFYLTIDENGKVIKAENNPESINLDNDSENRLIDIMLNMPKWNPATVKGNKVKYKILIGL